MDSTAATRFTVVAVFTLAQARSLFPHAVQALFALPGADSCAEELAEFGGIKLGIVQVGRDTLFGTWVTPDFAGAMFWDAKGAQWDM